MTEFRDKPVFCFTLDQEWVSEDCMAMALSFLESYSVSFNAFVTHRSETLFNYASQNDNVHLGLHPNFLPGSTHGKSYKEVIDHCFSLVPGAECFRSHAFYENTHILYMLLEKGIKYDSNLCLYLQENLVPLKHATGLIRFPVFWEDDVHFSKEGFSWNLEDYLKIFRSPGLKVFNFHPMNISLNVPDTKFYKKVKGELGESWRMVSSKVIKKYAWQGDGTRTFLKQILEFIKNEKMEIKNLQGIYEEYLNSL